MIEGGAQMIGSAEVTGRQPSSHLLAAIGRNHVNEVEARNLYQFQFERWPHMARMNRMGCLGAVFLFVKTR